MDSPVSYLYVLDGFSLPPLDCAFAVCVVTVKCCDVVVLETRDRLYVVCIITCCFSSAAGMCHRGVTPR